jgi:hypothetical protein
MPSAPQFLEMVPRSIPDEPQVLKARVPRVSTLSQVRSSAFSSRSPRVLLASSSPSSRFSPSRLLAFSLLAFSPSRLSPSRLLAFSLFSSGCKVSKKERLGHHSHSSHSRIDQIRKRIRSIFGYAHKRAYSLSLLSFFPSSTRLTFLSIH